LEPPDSIPNSEVKRCIADGSVGFPHVRVGHRQASKQRKNHPFGWFFFACDLKSVLFPVRGSDAEYVHQTGVATAPK
jgi:hypothetical protein